MRHTNLEIGATPAPRKVRALLPLTRIRAIRYAVAGFVYHLQPQFHLLDSSYVYPCTCLHRQARGDERECFRYNPRTIRHKVERNWDHASGPCRGRTKGHPI